MQQSTISKSKMSNSQQNNKSLIWKANDSKAQKNGPHSNIYWVKVSCFVMAETTSELRRLIKTKQMDRFKQVRRRLAG